MRSFFTLSHTLPVYVLTLDRDVYQQTLSYYLGAFTDISFIKRIP